LVKAGATLAEAEKKAEAMVEPDLGIPDFPQRQKDGQMREIRSRPMQSAPSRMSASATRRACGLRK
jgi:hypothetical protein